MLRQLIKEAALKVAAEARSEGDFAKLRGAVWLARRAAGIAEVHFSAEADMVGVVHLAPTRSEAHKLALSASCSY